MAFGRKPEQFWPLLWGAATLALAVVLALEHQFGRPTAGEGPRAPAKVAEAKLLPAFRLPPEQEAGSETLARPLFVPGRRPTPPAAKIGEGAIKRGQFILQGTTIVGPLSIAMLKEVSSGIVHRVEKGGEIKGMMLAEVSAEEVVLKAGDDSESLPLIVAKGSVGPAAAVERGPFGLSGTPAAPAPAASPASRASPAAGAAGAAAAVRSSGPEVQVVPAVPPAAVPSPALTPDESRAERRAPRRSQR